MVSTVVSPGCRLQLDIFTDNASHCIFDDQRYGATGTIPVPIYWVADNRHLSMESVVLYFVTCSLYEFVMAQTPNRMRE